MKAMKSNKPADKVRYLMFRTMYNKQGMEMVQVAILVAQFYIPLRLMDKTKKPSFFNALTICPNF
jgi:hypothetical protein